MAAKEVAETICNHLIHSDCLVGVGQALNADGARFGVGGFGPRSGCPICNTPVSCWLTSKEAAYFKGFWIKPIEDALLELGPDTHSNQNQTRTPVAGELVWQKLKESSTLTERQKELVRKPNYNPGFIGDDSDNDSGFCKALKFAGCVNYSVDQVMFSSSLKTRGIWKYDDKEDTLWHWDWGLQHPKFSSCAHCGAHPQNLDVCSGCKDSCCAPCYCIVNCQKADWSRHKQRCNSFQITQRGGTGEELLQRLREAGC